ncbi:putative kinesin light chain [Aspergillus tetrazonus]
MRPRSRNDFTIAIICALPLEADAVEALFDETYDRLGKHYGKQPGDASAYMNGRIGKHNVVLCYLPGMGKGSAASVASSLQVSYTGVELALVVGICGGAPAPPKYQEIFLGDVIISDSVIKYDFGRQYPGGFQRKTGIENTLGGPHRAIRALLNGVRAENARSELQTQIQQYLHRTQQTGTKWHRPRLDDILFKASYAHKHSAPAHPATCSCFQSDLSDQICEEALATDCDNLNCDKNQQIRHRRFLDVTQSSIYIGPVASADTVMKSGQHRDEIARKEKVIGFEMEGAGVLDNIPCIIIKGVCDYADSHKSKYWQAYAAAAGASAAKAFLEYWMPANRKGESRDRHFVVPFARNPQFVGRQEEIQKIENLISMSNGPRKVAITGLGGIGKTQIALELAYRMREREPDCSIFWIPCTNYEAVEQACMNIAQIVGIKNVQPAEVKERLKTYFSQTYNTWILIFDNADQINMWTKGNPTAPPLKNIIPWSEDSHILFTSRNHKLAVKLASPNILSISDVDQKTAKEIFRKYLVQKDLLQDNYITSTLLEQLAFLPLAITNYMSLLGEQERSTIELLSEEFDDDGWYAEAQTTVATTWLISFLEIQQVDEVASDYLSFMACINPRDIPEAILPSTTSAKQKVEALGLLKAYSFVSAQADNNILSLHRLVHLATRDWLRRRGTLDNWVERVAGQLDKVLLNENRGNQQVWRDYSQDKYDNLLTKIGRCLESDGRYAEAQRLLLNVLRIRERARGPEHPDSLASISNLGSVLTRHGKYEEAEAMHRQALQGYRKVLGSEHPNTLTSMHHLAFTLKRLGKLSEALTLINYHPHTVSSFNVLRGCETIADQLSRSQNQEASAVTLPTLMHVHTYAGNCIAPNSKSAGRKRRASMIASEDEPES